MRSVFVSMWQHMTALSPFIFALTSVREGRLRLLIVVVLLVGVVAFLLSRVSGVERHKAPGGRLSNKEYQSTLIKLEYCREPDGPGEKRCFAMFDHSRRTLPCTHHPASGPMSSHASVPATMILSDEGLTSPVVSKVSLQLCLPPLVLLVLRSCVPPKTARQLFFHDSPRKTPKTTTACPEYSL